MFKTIPRNNRHQRLKQYFLGRLKIRMEYFRRPFLRSLFVLLALTSLLLQARSVFACWMMDTAGPAQDCCCVEKRHHNDSSVCDEAAPCCEFSVELYPHSLDAGRAPLRVATELDHDPVYAGVIHQPAQVAQPPSLPPSFYRLVPASPGTHTYLATLRLRI